MINFSRRQLMAGATALGLGVSLPAIGRSQTEDDADYKHKNIFGLKIKGDSMDEEYKENTILHCVAFDPYKDTLENGDHVIVNAICVADEIETTVKEYQIDDDGQEWLVPKSKDRKYRSYAIPCTEEDNVYINGRKIKEISITAIVVGVEYSLNKI